MNAFRQEIVKLYKKCLITGFNEIECDAAHIIPQAICSKLNLTDIITNNYNGLLLNKTMHSTYDRFLWCFDIYDIEPIPSSSNLNTIPAWCYLKPIIVPSKTQLSINEYKDNLHMVPIDSLPFLWINYQMFMQMNFMDGDKNQDAEIYAQLLNSEYYKIIIENPAILLDKEFINNVLQSKDIVAITNKKGFGCQYQVLYQGQKWNDRQWIYNDDQMLPEMAYLNDEEWISKSPTTRSRSLF